MEEPNVENQKRGEVRTDMHCHACSKGFVALLDHDLEGKHVVECPHCGHEHWREIKAGVVTESRWGSDDSDKPHKCRRVWKHDVLKMKTTTASQFIRERWLNFGG